MSKPLIIEPEAEAQLREIYDWYEARRPGLGNDLMLCFEAALGRIKDNPRQFPVYFRQTRRVLMKRFPYLILFIELEEVVTVLAVFHTHRDPQSIRRRAR